MNPAPIIVKSSIYQEECWECASGNKSDAPIYSKNPAKNPKYIRRILLGIAKRKVESAPRTGAMASIKSKRSAFLLVFLWVNISVTVLSPSEKS